MKLIRPALLLAIAATAATGALAFAADPPRTSATSKTLYLAQNGCGTTAEPGRLEPRVQDDSADGCGTIGGLPADELIGYESDKYTSSKAVGLVKIDALKKVTGQLAAGSWTGTGGVGTVTFDVAMTATTTTGKRLDFGSSSVDAKASPRDNIVYVPFSLTPPAAAKGATLKTIVLAVRQHGMNIGMSSKKLNGESWLVIPTRKK
ncbi:MAG: hypothetical protein ABR549_05800 [Mycobacteriales bacterium]